MKSLLLPISVVAACALFGGCARATPEAKFWNWFKSNEHDLYDFEKDQERTFDQLSTQLHKLNPSLTFEFGPKQNGSREFVISADGIRDAFPEVEALYAAAPSLPHWRFTKFRPRRKPFDITYGGVSVQAASVLVGVKPNGGVADMAVFMPGYTVEASKTYTAIAFLFLDQALGEYDVETRVGRISVEPITKSAGKTYSLESLPHAVDALFATN